MEEYEATDITIFFYFSAKIEKNWAIPAFVYNKVRKILIFCQNYGKKLIFLMIKLRRVKKLDFLSVLAIF